VRPRAVYCAPMRRTQKGARGTHRANAEEWLPLEAPTFKWDVTPEVFDDELARIRNSKECSTAIQGIVRTIREEFFTPYRFDKATGFAAASENLIHLGYAVVRGAVPTRDTYLRDWFTTEEEQMAGKKPKEAVFASRLEYLRRLPKRVEDMASDIRRVNDWPLVAREGWCASLPAAMEHFAEMIRARIGERPSYRMPIHYLVKYVFESTGKTQPSGIAKLLSEVAGALNLPVPYTANEISDLLPPTRKSCGHR